MEPIEIQKFDRLLRPGYNCLFLGKTLNPWDIANKMKSVDAWFDYKNINSEALFNTQRRAIKSQTLTLEQIGVIGNKDDLDNDKGFTKMIRDGRHFNLTTFLSIPTRDPDEPLTFLPPHLHRTFCYAFVSAKDYADFAELLWVMFNGTQPFKEFNNLVNRLCEDKDIHIMLDLPQGKIYYYKPKIV